MKTNIIYQKDNYRIIEMLDEHYDMEDLKGDCFNAEYITDIEPANLKQKEIDFEQIVNIEGVYGYELQVWDSGIDKGWTHVDSCWGFVGAFDANSEYHNHFIVDELKSQIESKKVG